MEVKLFEIRDSMTFMPMLAIKFETRNEAERFLLARAGYGRDKFDQAQYVLLLELAGGDGRYNCDPYGWQGGARTLKTAHNYIIERWNDLASGDVVCVEHILGERPEPKVSERIRG